MVERKGKLFRVGYHRRGEGEASRHWLALNDLGKGVSFAELIKNAWDTATVGGDNAHLKDRYVDNVGYYECESGLVFKASVGHVGEPGAIVDSKSGKTVYEDKTGNVAKLGLLRVAYVQPTEVDGVFFVEYTSNGNIFGALTKVARAALSKHDPQLTIEFEQIVSGQDWLEHHAKLEELMIVMAQPSDALDELGQVGEELYRAEYSLRPPKGVRWFPRHVKEKILGRKVRPEDLMGIKIPEDVDKNNVSYKVKLGDGQRSKTMVLEKLTGIGIYEVISDAGEPMLTNEKLASLARERANEYVACRDGAQGK